MSERRHLLLIIGLLIMTAPVVMGQVNTAMPGQAVERHLPDQTTKEWSLDSKSEDIKRVKVCRVEDVCRMRYKEGQTPRTRVKNLVMPLRYEDETVPISDAFTKQVRQALNNLQDKQGVTVRFIGYTDDAPLTGRDESVYGDHLSLSKARAQRVALSMQGILGLPASAIESDGRGDSHPIASNATVQGRAMNRRVEVEFWYDDPLQELPDGPQLCPNDVEETVTKVYDPPWGSIPNIELADGQLVIPPGYAENLRRALTDIADRINARLRFIGYTKNEQLDRRTASVYSDDIGLSAERARRVMDILMKDPLLTGARSEHEGRGYVQSDDVVNLGFTQGEESFVRVQVVYDERLPLDNYEGVDITHQTQELSPKSPYDLNVMHITVDGKPIDDPERSSSDIQRCTDVALDNANIRFRLDNLESRRRLAVAADPVAVIVNEPHTELVPPIVHFRMYSSYATFIKRAEIRIFDQQSLQAGPLVIIAVDDTGLAQWQPAAEILAGPARQLKYLLRAYDAKGNFDETEARPLWLYHEASPGNLVKSDKPSSQALLAAYGENNLARLGIPLGSGTVKVLGGGIPAGYTVSVAGHQVPVDPKGNFIAEEILPNGTHTVEVAVLDAAGNGSLYMRDLEFKTRDLFFVGVADLTVSKNSVSAAEKLQQGDNPTQPVDSSLDGRLAFYLNGKVSENWHLTASADTQEGPVKDLFSNFMDKTPDSLFRRINPEYYYPTFGDDGVVEETAPTMGKFYVKASRGQDYGMWGDFKIAYVGNELAQVDRGLYGADTHFGSESTTSFGEKRLTVDGFAAQPGTLPSYEAFLGTGGSLYYLHHQDILTGSESVRIEVHDKASNIVTGVVNLQPNVDYTIDYLQGRLLLTEPLSATASDNLLVRTTGLSGDESFLVVRYEYTPGLENLDQVAVGGQGSYWFNDHVKLGVTANTNDGDSGGSLGGADLTLRESANSWFKVQAGRTTGILSPELQSNDGGFSFQSPDDTSLTTSSKADAYRADLNVGLSDFFKGHDGRLALYDQKIDAGYSAPGQMTLKDTEQFGGQLKMPVTSSLSLIAKGDQRTEDQGLDTRAMELDLSYKLTNRWSFSTGVRDDMRKDNSPVVPLTQEQGDRTDVVAQVKFSPNDTWSAYTFAQDTVATSDGRPDDSRIGLGGSYRLTKRFKIDAEASDGDLGPGGKIGTSFLYSERTTLYLNYSLENERTDNEELLQTGSWGNLVSGVKTRLSDSSSVYAEERYQTGDGQGGLTHAAGVNLVTKEHWNFGASGEFGKLFDSQTGAETNRKAAGIHMGYGRDKIQFSSAVEFRRDGVEQPDLSTVITNVLLLRNSLKYQVSPSWRLIGKLDYSTSTSSLGDFSTGGYTEGVVGYAYRPVWNDRLNALVKYTYFYNVPTTDQLGAQLTSTQYLEKSHIASLDVTYDLTANWSVGGKYAYRVGEASLDVTQPDFFDDTAQLAVLRLDWRFLKQWDTLAEVRQLDLPDINQRNRGVLAAIYRHISKNLKAGFGYNFSNFSDEMTDLRYNHRGVFFNIIGTK
jgi:flagellar motor protein MotB